jgi:alpha-tubulin suppressor-like RCC1 family protein
MRLWGWLVAAGMLVGCYSPSLPEDQPCSETGKCPGGLTCDLATGTCVSQTPEAAHFTTISAAFGHACGIDPDGALFCWGDGLFGKLGTGDLTARLEPTRVGTESDWRIVTAGENTTCGIRADASLWCWGVDLTGANNDDLLPVQVPGSYSLVDSGDDGYCAVETDGTTQCRFRTSNMLARQDLPAVVSRPSQIAYTHSTACVIDDQAALYCWGSNQFAQLGDGTTLALPDTAPNKISGSWKSIALGAEHACAVATDGALSCWGSCGFGVTGHTSDCEFVTRVGLDTYKSVAAGLFHTCAIRDDGAMVCFGENPSGELGAFGSVGGATPRVNADFNDWSQVIAGERFTCALRANQEAWCWGTNLHGELGDGGGEYEFDPVTVDAGPWTAIHVGDHTACGIRADGSLWCWGSNAFGQIGDGSVFQRSRPVQVGTDRDWLAVAPGQSHTCGIRSPGQVFCWGDNTNGKLGNGSVLASLAPVRVGANEDWTEIAVSSSNTCGVKAGQLFCWGRNIGLVQDHQEDQLASLTGFPGSQFMGLIGNAAFDWDDNSRFPVSSTIMDWSTIVGGLDHACGLRGTGAWCFGQNPHGELGRDGGVAQQEAIQEQTQGAWTSVQAGGGASCGIAMDQHLACWGRFDMIGAGPRTADTDMPTTIGSAKWRAVSIGTSSACGIQADGTLACWGSGDIGVLGDGRGGHERPTRVKPPN